MIEKHISEKELANRWSVSYRTLQRWRGEGGGLPHIKLGRSIRYPISAIEAYENKSIRIPLAVHIGGTSWKE